MHQEIEPQGHCELIEKARRAGPQACNMLRKVVALYAASKEFPTGVEVVSEEGRRAVSEACSSIYVFFNHFYPSFFEGNNNSHLKQSLEYQKEYSDDDSMSKLGRRMAPHFNWLEYYCETRGEDCQKLVDAVIDNLFISDKDRQILKEELKPDSTDEDVYRLLHAPKELPGLRFLPGYRALEWNTEENEGPVYKIVLSEKALSERIDFEAVSGRQFLIATLGDVYDLENLFLYRTSSKAGAVSQRPVVSGIVVSEPKAHIGYAIFDIDKTLYRYWKKDDSEWQRAVIKAMNGLNQSGIPIGIWSCNYERVVKMWSEIIKDETGISTPLLTYWGNWPFHTINFTYPGSEYAKRAYWWSKKHIEKYMQKNFGEAWQAPIPKDDFYKKHFLTLKRAEADGYGYKAPFLLALWKKDLSQEERNNLFAHGTLIDDYKEYLESVLTFGYNFVHVPGSKEASPTNILKFI
jgi:hypothetical protein